MSLHLIVVTPIPLDPGRPGKPGIPSIESPASLLLVTAPELELPTWNSSFSLWSGITLFAWQTIKSGGSVQTLEQHKQMMSSYVSLAEDLPFGPGIEYPGVPLGLKAMVSE